MKYLRTMAESDIYVLKQWRNHPDYKQWFRQGKELSDKDQEAWYKSLSLNDSYFIIHSQLSFRGYCYLRGIDYIHRDAEFGIFTTPVTNIGYFALKELFDYGFNSLGLHRIHSDVIEGNPALKLYKLMGFVQEGTLRKAYFKNGSWVDSTIIGMLKEDWDAFVNRRNGVNRQALLRNFEEVGT